MGSGFSKTPPQGHRALAEILGFDRSCLSPRRPGVARQCPPADEQPEKLPGQFNMWGLRFHRPGNGWHPVAKPLSKVGNIGAPPNEQNHCGKQRNNGPQTAEEVPNGNESNDPVGGYPLVPVRIIELPVGAEGEEGSDGKVEEFHWFFGSLVLWLPRVGGVGCVGGKDKIRAIN